MQTRRILIMTALTLALLGSLAVSSVLNRPATWIVGAAGGPGVHFTDIPPAIAAADEGDLILVLAGTYSGFDLSKALTIVGEPGAWAKGPVKLQSVPEHASLASLRVTTLEVLDCDHAVILDELRIGGFPALHIASIGGLVGNIESSADVRLVDCSLDGFGGDGGHGLRVLDSRVEIVSSTLSGDDGADDDCTGLSAYAGEGGDGMRVEGSSRVHASRSTFTGGDGGYAGAALCQIAYAGDGGSGALAFQPGEVILTGGAFTGGDGGAANGGLGYTYCGSGGSGIAGSAQLRHSGVKYTRGEGPGSCPEGSGNGLGGLIPAPGDPTLERLGIPVAGFFGQPVTLRVRGYPGAKTRLLIGSRPAVAPSPAVEIELLLEPRVAIDLGRMPGKGYVDYVLPLGPDWPVALHDGGRLLLTQAVCVFPGGELRRTNSVPLVLR